MVPSLCRKQKRRGSGNGVTFSTPEAVGSLGSARNLCDHPGGHRNAFTLWWKHFHFGMPEVSGSYVYPIMRKHWRMQRVQLQRPDISPRLPKKKKQSHNPKASGMGNDGFNNWFMPLQSEFHADLNIDSHINRKTNEYCFTSGWLISILQPAFIWPCYHVTKGNNSDNILRIRQWWDGWWWDSNSLISKTLVKHLRC